MDFIYDKNDDGKYLHKFFGCLPDTPEYTGPGNLQYLDKVDDDGDDDIEKGGKEAQHEGEICYICDQTYESHTSSQRSGIEEEQDQTAANPMRKTLIKAI